MNPEIITYIILGPVVTVYLGLFVYLFVKLYHTTNKSKYTSKYVDEGRDLDQHWSKLK